MNKYKTGGLVYPQSSLQTLSYHDASGYTQSVDVLALEGGMTLLDYFAGQALPALIEKLNVQGLYREQHPGDSAHVARAAYTIAAAMLEARKENRE